jgi:hypothetical protein
MATYQTGKGGLVSLRDETTQQDSIGCGSGAALPKEVGEDLE